MIKVILVGLGHLGKWHAQKIDFLQEAEFVAVVDPAEGSEKKIQELKLNVPLYRSLDDLSLDFDAAIVAVPTSFHFEVCKKLLEMSKHIFCEKPMTSTYSQAIELSHIQETKNVVFQVGHSERFHQVWESIKDKKEYFEDKPLIYSNRQASFKGRATDVDVVQDLMIHDLDILLFLLNETPSSIKAIGKKIRTDKWDYVEATLEFPSGSVASLRVGRNYTHEVRDFEVVNNCGTLRVDLFKGNFYEASGSAEEPDNFVVESVYPKRDHLLEEQKLFYHAINNGTAPCVNIQDGLKAVYLVEKVLESLETGCIVEC